MASVVSLGNTGYNSPYYNALHRRVRPQKVSINPKLEKSNWNFVDMLGINRINFLGKAFILKNIPSDFQAKKRKYTKPKKAPEVMPAYNAIINQRPAWIPVIYSGMVKLPAVYQPKENELLKGFIEYDSQQRSFPPSNFNYYSEDNFNDTTYDQNLYNSGDYHNTYEVRPNSYKGSVVKPTSNIKPARDASVKTSNWKSPVNQGKQIPKKKNISKYEGHLNNSSLMNEKNNAQTARGQELLNNYSNNNSYNYKDQEMLSNSSFYSYANSETSWMDFKTYLPQPLASNHLTTPISANKFHPGFNYAPKFQYHYNYYYTEDFTNALLSDNEDSDTLDNFVMDRLALSPITTSRERLQSGCSQIDVDYSS